MNIGLTGGIGCGKSTVLKLFAERGAVVFESDACVRQLLAEHEGLKSDLETAFGNAIFDEGRKVDRAKLASIVFANPSELRKLEGLVHPLVRQRWEEEKQLGHRRLVVEIPLLFEKGLDSSFDLNCCVVSDSELQLQRLHQRGWSDEQIRQRLGQQWGLEEKAKRADLVILNNGSLEHLAAQVNYIFQHTI